MIKYFKNSLLSISIFGLSFMLSNFAFGQQTKKEGSIQNEDIVIDKERKIELQPQISRTFDPLQEIENKRKGRKMKYDFTERKLDDNSLPTVTSQVISPRSGEDISSEFGGKYKNMLKFGIGNYAHTYFNAHLGFTPDSNQFRGIYVYHDANRRGPTNSVYSGRSENEIKLYSKTYTSKYILNGQISYNNSVNNYYGRMFEPINYPNNFLEVSYDKFLYSGSIANSKLDSKFDYLATSSLNFTSSSNLDKEWIWDSKFNGIMKINDELSSYIDVQMILSEYTTTENNRRQLYKIKPSFFYKTNKVSVHAGINVVNEKDKLKGSITTQWYPVVKLDVKATQFLHLFAGLGGDTHFYSYLQNINQNPWLDKNLELMNPQETTNLFAGFKGSNEKNIDYEIKFNYSEFANLGFFIPTAADTSKYKMVYVGGTKKVQNYNVSGQVNFQLNERLLSILRLEYNEYLNIGDLARPYAKPLLNISFNNSITFKDRIIISPDIYYMNGLYGFNPATNKEVKLNDIIDLNLKVNYLISKKFNASVSINNILDKQYQKYLNYRVQGINYTVGLSHSFN
ncbi:hypothetical protein EOJ36_00575 [Sandaracinomonas limnophila]|uniref:TonB-dependent receptor n=1 Tax=Sandaracinomonas limnophila TaxID=1862386 RepID=A0A437PW92_9BACT|nr:hypothetical protein [Sandaracinomonas limnophila]RVU26523.1 hypothetical protein EOJ36_00575 [Sandaracinomonas limnophila]